MNDDELDLWLSIHNEQFDAQINAKINIEQRRQQVASAAAPGRVRRAILRRGSLRPKKRSSGHLSPRVSARYRRRSTDATRGLAVILVVLFLLVSSAVLGDLVNDWGAERPAGELDRSMIIGVPTNVAGTGMMQETHRYGLAYDLANWLAEDLSYRPKTFHGYYDLDNSPDYYMGMLSGGQVDMLILPDAVAGQLGKDVLFAGPYLTTQGGVLVRADNTAIHTVEDLKGKRVCTWGESTYHEQSKQLGTTVEENLLTSCVDALVAGGVDAVAGDQLLLSEIAEDKGANTLSVVPGLNFGGQQRYGIALENDRASECEQVRDAIRRFVESGAWDQEFRANMPEVPPAAYKPDPDHLDPCE